jgi:hypothetical protein
MEQPLHDDLMIGVEAIAKFTGQKERRVFHMLAIGQLPGFKLGNKWAAKKSTLQQHIDEREREGAREAAARREAAERKAALDAAAKPERKPRKRKARKRVERDIHDAA